MKASRLHTLALAAICLFALTSLAIGRRLASDSAPGGVSPAGQLSELAIEAGESGCALGPSPEFQGRPGFGWANKLTPSTYPATLRTITVGFNRGGALIDPDQLFRIVVFLDPEGDGPSNGQQPDATFIGRVRGVDSIMTYNLITPVRIQGGAFVVGVFDDFAVSRLDQSGRSTFPAIFSVPGKSIPPGSESFFTGDSGTVWGRMSDLTIGGQCGVPGSFLIRATVESDPAQTLSATRIKDPEAVEPWAVAIIGGDAYVANYVSDNLTIIKTSDNSFINVPVGDGPGGTPDGPAGIAVTNNVIAGVATTRAYVSLFGSNTIPSKEFPIDYSTVGPGRVQVLGRSSVGGNINTVTQINVGKGPRFPALAGAISAGPQKVYVPCAGSNRVDVIDTLSNLKIKEITVGREPTSCTSGLGGNKVYVTNFGDDTISVIDTTTDLVIKTMRLPQATGGPPLPPPLTNPWNAEVSNANGNLYVTYWGREGDETPNGGIAEFDTCKGEFLRLVIDDTTRGTPPGSAGASGIAASTGPLTRDSATGLTPGAGGGGGGPFGIAGLTVFQNIGTILFTNDGAGTIGVIDARIDQVVSAPPLSVASCPKPRDLGFFSGVLQPSMACVACGQPDSSVLVVSLPGLPENLTNVPVPSGAAIFLDPTLEIDGTGFTPGLHLELIVNGECVAFRKDPKIKKRGTVIIQKGSLVDGRSLSQVLGFTTKVRLVTSDGQVRLANCCGIP
jgi:YVTN family beta-propeller protein